MRFIKPLLLLMGIAFFNLSSMPGGDIQNDWRFIADKWVNYGVDRDVIHLGNIKDDFRQLKLRITDGPLKMYDMKVHFDNGGVQDVPLRSLFRQGSETRIIDLDGGLRHLNKIEFWYETKGFRKGKARVAVWGRR